MNLKLKINLAICLIFLGLSACETTNEIKTPFDYVDMLIGTAEQGNTVVSSARPFAMVKPGPDTEKKLPACKIYYRI